MQNKILQAQLQAKKAEKNLVSKKYDSGYPTVFDNMNKALDEAFISYAHRFDKVTSDRQSGNEKIIKKVWDDGMRIDHTKYKNDNRSYRDMLNIHKMKFTACNTLAEADLEFCKIEDQYNKFFSDWKIKTAESANRWIAHFDKLVIEANNQVANLAQNVPNQNPVPQDSDDLLQQLNAIKAENDILKAQSAQKDQVLAQQDNVINALSQGIEIVQGAIAQTKQLIQEKDIKIRDQKVTIDDQKATINDLKEDKTMLKEKIVEQKVTIDNLTVIQSEQAEKLDKISEKYIDLKTLFTDLVNLHKEDHSDYVPVVDLAGLNLDQ